MVFKKNSSPCLCNSKRYEKFKFIQAIIFISIFSFCFFVLIIYIAFISYIAYSTKAVRDYKPINARASNVILMIGDGMGFNHLEVGKAYGGLNLLTMEEFAHQNGKVITRSLVPPLLPTDSAAAASAMSTGIKHWNMRLATMMETRVQNLGEYAKTKNRAVGIVATETLTGATPAGFSSHSHSRRYTDEIFMEQLKSEVDLFMGAGKEYFITKQDEFPLHEIDFFSSMNDVKDFGKQTTHPQRLFVSFNNISVNDENAGTDEAPTLSQMTEFALNYLLEKETHYTRDGNNLKKKDGFFIMIEGSFIDKKSHGNEILPMANEVLAFDKAVKVAMDFVDKKSPNTIIIITADHETGGLKYNGETKEELNNNMFHKTSHTPANVPYFIYGDIDKLDEKIDNTHISKIIRDLLL